MGMPRVIGMMPRVLGWCHVFWDGATCHQQEGEKVRTYLYRREVKVVRWLVEHEEIGLACKHGELRTHACVSRAEDDHDERGVGREVGGVCVGVYHTSCSRRRSPPLSMPIRSPHRAGGKRNCESSVLAARSSFSADLPPPGAVATASRTRSSTLIPSGQSSPCCS